MSTAEDRARVVAAGAFGGTNSVAELIELIDQAARYNVFQDMYPPGPNSLQQIRASLIGILRARTALLRSEARLRSRRSEGPTEVSADAFQTSQNSQVPGDGHRSDWCLAVGISEYHQLPSLRGPDNDARAFHAWACSPSGGAVPQTQAVLVTASEGKLSASSLNELFANLIDNVQRGTGQPKCRLYLFFSGHTFGAQYAELALLMPGATSVLMEHFPITQWANKIVASALFSEVFLFVDGSRTQSGVAISPPPIMLGISPGPPSSYFCFLATEPLAKSFEQPGSDGMVHGIFSEALLEGLKGAAAGPGGDVTADSLRAFISSRLSATAPNRLHQQRPVFYFQGPDVVIGPTRIPAGRPSNVFIFQSVPKRFDLREKLMAGKPDTWEAIRYRDQMRPDDIVFFWMGGNSRRRGLYGWGRITSLPYFKKGWDKPGVDVIYEVKFREPILVERFRDDKILSQLLIIRAPQGTNFLLSEEQAHRLIDLLRESGQEVPPLGRLTQP